MANMYNALSGTIRIPYSFICEYCGKTQLRTHTVSAVTEVGLSPELAREKALKGIGNKVFKLKVAAEAGDFYWVSPDPCPDCGHTQFWQLKAQKSVTRTLMIWLIILLVLDMVNISGLILGTPVPLAWVLTAFFLVITGLLLRSLIRMKKRYGVAPSANRSGSPKVDWPVLF